MRRISIQRAALAAIVGGIGISGAARWALPALYANAGAERVAYGKAIANFTLPNAATGKNVDFSTLSAGKKATVVIFMSTHCPVSNAYEQRIEAVATKYAPQGVQVIGVFPDVGEDSQEVADHAKQDGLTFPCLRDGQNTVTDQFYAKVTPEVYVADSKGTLVYHGPVDDNQNPSQVSQSYLTSTLNAVLAGKPAPIQTRRAFGCQIHRP